MKPNFKQQQEQQQAATSIINKRAKRTARGWPYPVATR